MRIKMSWASMAASFRGVTRHRNAWPPESFQFDFDMSCMPASVVFEHHAPCRPDETATKLAETCLRHPESSGKSREECWVRYVNWLHICCALLRNPGETELWSLDRADVPARKNAVLRRPPGRTRRTWMPARVVESLHKNSGPCRSSLPRRPVEDLKLAAWPDLDGEWEADGCRKRGRAVRSRLSL